MLVGAAGVGTTSGATVIVVGPFSTSVSIYRGPSVVGEVVVVVHGGSSGGTAVNIFGL